MSSTDQQVEGYVCPDQNPAGCLCANMAVVLNRPNRSPCASLCAVGLARSGAQCKTAAKNTRKALTQGLDRVHAAHVAGLAANLHHVHRVVVALQASKPER